ncbi:unnamed protein product [Bursaphelenchus okinawaensis]|uniref:Saposin A-type domain-containing protein n=1 Tax=Bursaphelenchus okinawaensis TaxID=465554 RepID=A0A811K852_9BILA|nr:unnamed protein product [Bursaphelenchus okinawaensis]CAG9093690.1 unnamed protein product [Bursaphelenchus okinawaensis]
MFLILLLCLLVPLSLASGIDCSRVPPSLWCLNPELSKECNVEEQCKSYLSKSKGQKVQLTLLFEALCPDCEEFITGTFYHDIYLKHGDKIDIELVPYGNARIDEQGNVVCQHGKDECRGNKYEACVIHYMPEPLPFIRCIELQLPKVDIEKAVQKCYNTFKTAAHVVDQVTHCFNGKVGDKLIQAHAERTKNIFPEKHTGVPWVLFNNVSLNSAQKFAYTFDYAIDDWYVGQNAESLWNSDLSQIKMCRNNNYNL